MGFFDTIFNKGKIIREFASRNAVVIDVRSKGEFSSGHYNGSVNIPLDSIPKNIKKIKKMNKPIIACCASGMRSSIAASQLNGQGIESMNGGSWGAVQNALNK